MIFYKWDDVYNYKDKMFILVDNDFKFSDKYIQPYSEFDINKPCDYIDNLHPNLLIYVAHKHESVRYNNRGEQIVIAPHFETHTFKKNKLYPLAGANRWYDEINNRVDDIYYDPFMFVKEKDYNKAIRALKLKAIEKNLTI